jgi:hypothetical protein
MRFPDWKRLAAAIVVLSAAAPSDPTSELARLVIVNRGGATLRGRVLGAGDTARPFFVLADGLREMPMEAGVATVEVDSEPTSVRRVTLVRGETTTVAYGGT